MPILVAELSCGICYTITSNVNLLTEDDIEVYDVGEDLIIVIYVPMEKREQRPIYINDDLFDGTFRRDHSGDYHCTKSQVKAMLRDQTDDTMDMKVLDDIPMEDLNYETDHACRNSHRALRPVHDALREALANCLVNAEYFGVRGVVIKKEQDKLILENPGYIRTGKEQMRIGGISDPRNKILLKMFNMVDVGERASEENK